MKNQAMKQCPLIQNLKKLTDMAKVVRIVQSCDNQSQLETASKVVLNYERLYGRSDLLVDIFYSKSLKVLV